MKITVLTDNNSLIDRYYLAEPAFCLFIEEAGKRILFDTGYSDVFRKNGEKMGVDFNLIDTIVISHGHNDHTGGLQYLSDLRQSINVYAHPEADEGKSYEGLDISMPVRFEQLNDNFKVTLSRKPLNITDKLVFLGEIERNWQQVAPLEEDDLEDDTAMVYKGEKGLFIITGCSHSGIINICEYSKKVTGINRINGIIGGFHMLDNDRLNREVRDYFRKQDIDVIYPCHCTDLKAKIALSQVADIREVGVSLQLEIS